MCIIDIMDEFSEQFEEANKKREELNIAMVHFKGIYDSMIAAGFSDEATATIIAKMLRAG